MSRLATIPLSDLWVRVAGAQWHDFTGCCVDGGVASCPTNQHLGFAYVARPSLHFLHTSLQASPEHLRHLRHRSAFLCKGPLTLL